MKKFSFLILISLLFSCINDEDIPSSFPSDGSFTLSIRVPGIVTPGTYAPLEGKQENEVKEIDVLVFEPDESNVERLKYIVQGTDIVQASGIEDKSIQSFKVKLNRTEKPVRLVVIANAHDNLATVSLNETKATVLDKITYQLQNKWPTGSSSDPVNERFKPFPMWGETKKLLSVTSLVDFNDAVILVRAVAKVDVGIDLYTDPALGFGQRFLLKKIIICNVPDRGSVAPKADNVVHENNKVTITEPNIPTMPGYKDIVYDYVWDKENEDRQKFFNEIYITENSKTSSKRTFLVIAGNLDGNQQLTYYRIDIAANNNGDNPEYLNVLRNYRYLFNITGIRDSGFLTLEDAKAAEKGSNLECSLEVTNDILCINYSGQHLLGVDNEVFLLGWKEQEINIRVLTNYSNGWQATTTADWISFNPNIYEGTVVSELGKKISNENPNRVANISTSISQNTTGNRTAIIKLRAGDITLDIKVTQSAGANCIIAKKGEKVYIPWGHANSGGVQRVPADDTKLKIEALWQESNVIGSMSLVDNGVFAPNVIIGTANKGNAIVVLRDKTSNEILWSWHIWINPSTYPIKEVKFGKKTFMDRNLGALSTTYNTTYSDVVGLYYQWGRKDPFCINSTAGGGGFQPAADFKSFTTASVTATNNLANSVKNPNVFYLNSKDWHGTTISDNNLWGNSGEKTIYDPCPEGWRVPTSGTGERSPWKDCNWSNATYLGSGFKWFNGFMYNNLFIPSGGSFDGNTGTRSAATLMSNGFLWSATPSGQGAFGFRHYVNDGSGQNENNSFFDPSFTSNNRADAYPVRCVKIEY